ncbi:hypothetical protein E3T48_00035, partial [Cryobacterium fucosi]
MRRRRPPRREASPGIDDVARVTQRLAVLLSAGVSPASAWQHLVEVEPPGSVPTRPATAPPRLGRSLRGATGEPPPTARIVRMAAAAGKKGDSIADAVAAEAGAAGGQVGDAWLGLAAAWLV